MALSGACAIIGRHALYRSVTITLENCRQTAIYLTSKYSTTETITETEIAHIFDDLENKPKQKLSSAMKAYLQRAKEYDEFIKKERIEYKIGKRHLANMMGQDPELFTQGDVHKAIKYLFPSGLFEKRARPVMDIPEKMFPPKKAAEFDSTGRPHHSLFYTMKPNYYQGLYDIVEHLENLNKIQDDELSRGLLPNEENRMNLLSSDWLGQDSLEKLFLENLLEKDYDAFIKAAERLASHPYSESVKDFIMKFRKVKVARTKKLITEPLSYDKHGRPFVVIKDCKKKSSRGIVKILGNGTGKITINGKDITYFERRQHREQVSYF